MQSRTVVPNLCFGDFNSEKFISVKSFKIKFYVSYPAWIAHMEGHWLGTPKFNRSNPGN